MAHTVRTGILILVTAIQLASQVTGLPLPDFFPFGPNLGDQTLPPGNEESATVALQQAVPYYGESRGYITVHTNGELDLRVDTQSSSFASIYVFSADVDTRSVGQVFYRESSDPLLLESTRNIVGSILPAFSATPPTSLFIATWFYVGYFDNNDDRANTFQCVLGTDGNISFAFLLYADEMIEWTTGDADGGIGGLGGDPADVGFIDDDGVDSVFIPGSNTSDILNVDTTTNVGLPGAWLFQVDGETISNPSLDECLDIDSCDPNAVCIDLSDGFQCICDPGFIGDGFTCILEDSGSGSGNESTTDLPVEESDVFIGFTEQEYTVEEDAVFVTLSIFASGFITNVSREVHVLFYTDDGTAEAPQDYEGTVNILAFNQSGVQNVTVQIFDDDVAEDPEEFTVRLITTQDLVNITASNATVTIEDDDEILCPDPVDIDQGIFTFTGNSVGDTATYTCDSGFKLEGVATLTCTRVDSNSSVFSPAPPVCIPLDCDCDPCDENAECIELPGAGNFICRCIPPFQGDGFSCTCPSGGGDDPHFSIALPTGQLLCFTVQGEHNFAFNLIGNEKVHMNAMFLPDSRRSEVTWMGSIGITAVNSGYKMSNATSLRFVAKENMVYIGDKVVLHARNIERLTFTNGKLTISEAPPFKGFKYPEVLVDLHDVSLSFSIKFMNEHLDIFWHSTGVQTVDSHGLIGQFFRKGIEIDEVRKILIMPNKEPVPVMRRPVWSFMEREVKDDQLCWTAMNPGYQGEGLIDGTYFDYLVNDVLSTAFQFKKQQ